LAEDPHPDGVRPQAGGKRGRTADPEAACGLVLKEGKCLCNAGCPREASTIYSKKKFSIINIQDLSRFEQQSIVDDDAFRAAGLLKNRTEGIKLLGKGEIVYPLTLNIKACSRSARAKVESAGGIIRGC